MTWNITSFKCAVNAAMLNIDVPRYVSHKTFEVAPKNI